MSSVLKRFKPLTDRLNQLPWIISHLKYYIELNTHVLSRGVPLHELLILKFPFNLPDAAKPPLLSVDITDACDIKCQYCNNPLFPHPRTMMTDETVNCLLKQMDKVHINRTRLGGGEPTLHPKFPSILKDICKRTRFVSVITNAQWKDPALAEALVSAGTALVEISVDAGGANMYEHSRQGASYTTLISNLRLLHETRNRLKSKMKIKIRLMLRPSTLQLEKEETANLLNYCDCVLPQMVMQHPECDTVEDVFMQKSIARHSIPICSVPFKDLHIRPTGMIPICPAKGCALDPNEQIFIGNVCTDDILALWKGKQMKELRAAHRSRTGTILEVCRDCHYG
jgi:pyruvate-formate lyase-activating enzyme